MKRFQMMFARYMKPLGEGDEGGGGAADRGDNFIPDDADVAADEAAKAAAAAAKTPTAEELEAERVKLGLAAGKPADAVAELTEEEKAAAAAADEEKANKGKDTRIPLSRHTAILEKERAAREAVEAQLAAAQKGAVLAKTNEEIATLEARIGELEEKYTKALADGETKLATDLMKEIRTTERTVIEQKAEFRSQAATAQAIVTIQFEAAVDRIEAAYPALNKNHADYDSELTENVLDLMDSYKLKGMAPAAALQKAVTVLAKPATAKQETATTVTPRVTNAEAEAAAAKTAREAEARKRNLDAAGKQPPTTSALGANSDEAGGKLDAKAAIKMPFEKFKDLSEEDLARMRGDTM